MLLEKKNMKRKKKILVPLIKLPSQSLRWVVNNFLIFGFQFSTPNVEG